jgi:hypothetical protein
VSIRSVVKSVVSPSGGFPGPCTTTPAFTSPMIIRNKPMPIAIARLRSIGIAFSTALRNPVSTRRVMMMPSTTITPIASG